MKHKTVGIRVALSTLLLLAVLALALSGCGIVDLSNGYITTTRNVTPGTNRPTVTTSQVTMLGCEYQASDGSYKGNGLSLLFRLCHNCKMF